MTIQTPAPDWGVGRYEEVAHALVPAARVVVDTAAIGPQDRVLDLGCGSGNAALLAAPHAKEVIGVDPAARLLDVARARTAAAGEGTTRFISGRAEELPLGDDEIDVALSVFGIVFAADAEAVARELSRVLTPRGRIIFSAFLPGGTIFRYVSLAEETVRRAVGAPPPPNPFRWAENDAVTALFGQYGFRVSRTEHSLAYSADSPEDFLERQVRNHPLAVAGLAVLERTGGAADLRDRLLRILREGNEDPSAFKATSRYVVVKVFHDAG